MRQRRQQFSFIRLNAYLRTRKSFIIKNKTPPERGLAIVRRRRQQFSFIRLHAYLRTREPFIIKNKTPPERGLAIVRRRRQRLSFIRLRVYLRTRESFFKLLQRAYAIVIPDVTVKREINPHQLQPQQFQRSILNFISNIARHPPMNPSAVCISLRIVPSEHFLFRAILRRDMP